MYKVVKKENSIERKISDKKSVFNYITKDISLELSLAVIRGYDLDLTEITIENNRIYYIIKGTLFLNFQGEELILEEGDSCFISKGTSYIMSGAFEVVTVDQPAFGSNK